MTPNRPRSKVYAKGRIDVAVSPLSVDQEEALSKMRVGCILNGGVGSGKSRTGLAFYYVQNGGRINTDHYIRMTNPQDLYIITTARKRDTGEWEGEFHADSRPKEKYIQAQNRYR